MIINKTIQSFNILGCFLRQFNNDNETKSNDDKTKSLNIEFYDSFNELIKSQQIYNAWFTETFVRNSIYAISEWLTEFNLLEWIEKYPQKNNANPKKVGVVIAGNIPLVGFHDFLSVLITGNIFIGKLSSKDSQLLVFISEVLKKINPELEDYIYFEEKHFNNIDAVIATGSNNTSRYFEYYFNKYPHIIRKSRSSVAILTGDETREELTKLSDDIFLYFGLGCRNVSKLYVPANYKFDTFFESIEKYSYLYNHNKYANNYDYNKSILLVNITKHFDNGFLLLKESEEIFTPISVIYYEYYYDDIELSKKINILKENIQCIITKDINFANRISIGESQYPKLTEYADNIDVIDFLIKLNK